MPKIDDICPGAFAEPPLIRVNGPTTGSGIRSFEEQRLAITTAQKMSRHSRIAIASYVPESFQPGGIPILQADGDAYPFTADQGRPITGCGTCQGTGEIIEFPADEDERLVACPACGGTGEALRMREELTAETIEGIFP